MSAELIGIITAGAVNLTAVVALARLALQQIHALRRELQELRKEVAGQGERLARIEGAVLGPWRPEAEKEG